MTSYRRSNIAGATYFFTVNLALRSQSLLTENMTALRAAIRSVKERHPFTTDAFVVLPNHLHAIWTLPDGDNNFALRWRQIKSLFSRHFPPIESRSTSRFSKNERGI
jgi:putative transposase